MRRKRASRGACSTRATRIMGRTLARRTGTRKLDRGGAKPGGAEVDAGRGRWFSALKQLWQRTPGPGVRAPGLGVGAALRAGRRSGRKQSARRRSVRCGRRWERIALLDTQTGRKADRRHGRRHIPSRRTTSFFATAGSDAATPRAHEERSGSNHNREAPVPGGVERARGFAWPTASCTVVKKTLRYVPGALAASDRRAVGRGVAGGGSSTTGIWWSG